MKTIKANYRVKLIRERSFNSHAPILPWKVMLRNMVVAEYKFKEDAEVEADLRNREKANAQ